VYGPDPWGNLTEIQSTQCASPTLSQAITTKNQFAAPMVYDAAGNLTNDGSHPFTYDTENRLVTAGGVTYTYDGDGKRVKKSNGTLYWTGPGWDPLLETDLSGNATAEYVFFNGKRVARVDMPGNSPKYYFEDHLGSTDIVTNPTGGIVEESDYVPYGGEVVINGSDPNHFKFNGKERDTESGLDEFGARYYSSGFGRFMIPDWAATATAVPYANFGNPQSLNLYSYVQNNPTTLGDPDGHELTVDPALSQAVNQLRAESPSFNNELRAHEGPTNPDLVIKPGITPNDADGVTPTTGNTQVSLSNDPLVTTESYKSSTVTVSDSVMQDTSQIQDVLGHEIVGHVNDARTNTQQYWNDSQYTHQHKGKTPGCESNCRDKRPEEQRANNANDRVKAERKEYQRQQKELKKEQKEEEKRKRKKKEKKT
jgi:RHS repeat-associated protein